MAGKVYGLWKWRPWTHREDNRVRAGGTARLIAADLGRTEGAVLQRRRVLGLVPAGQYRARDRAVTRLHGAGWSDADIADILDISPATVRICRARLGLPPNREGGKPRE